MLFRIHGEHDQLPVGGGEEAADGRSSTGKMPAAPHGGGTGGSRPGTGNSRPLQRVGRELPESDALLRHHLDVLRSLERYPTC